MTNPYYVAPVYPTDFTRAKAAPLRQQFAALESAFDRVRGSTGAYEAGGTANALTLTLPVSPSSYTDGLLVHLRPTLDNTGAATLNVNGLGAVPILTRSLTALVAGDLRLGSVDLLAYYDGNFILVTNNDADAGLRPDLASGTWGALLVAWRAAGTGGVLRTLWAKLSDLPLSIKDFGADGTSANDTPAINATIAAAYAAGLAVKIPQGNFTYIGNLYSAPVKSIEGEGSPVVRIEGRWQFESDANVIAATTLSVDAALGATTISVASATGIVAGRLLVIYDTTIIDTAYNRGSYTTAMVKSVAGTTITLEDPLVFPLFAAASVSVRPAMGIRIKGIRFERPPDVYPYCLVFSGLVDTVFEDSEINEPTRQKGYLNNALFMQQCHRTRCSRVKMDGPLYGISAIGGRFHQADEIEGVEMRHPIDASFGASDITVNGLVTDRCAAALNSHPAVFNLTYRNVVERNSSEWFNIRALGVTLENIRTIYTAAPTGDPGIHINFHPPAYAALNQAFDLTINNWSIEGAPVKALDLPYGRLVRLNDFVAPNMDVAISGGDANQVTSVWIGAGCKFRSQSGTRLNLPAMSGDNPRLDAVQNATVYEIKTFSAFLPSKGYSVRCEGELLPQFNTGNFSQTVKIFTGFGYGPAAFMQQIGLYLTLIIADNGGTRRKTFPIYHDCTNGTVAISAAIADQVNGVPADVALTAAADYSHPDAPGQRVTHWVSFSMDVTMASAPRDVSIAYELQLIARA